MKIEGLPPEPGFIKNISGRKTPITGQSSNIREKDILAISGNAAPGDISELAGMIREEHPVREGLVEAVRDRVSRNVFNGQDIQEETAERLADSPALVKIVSAHRELSDSPSLSERVESAKSRAVSGYYDNPDALASLAERLIEAMGLDRIVKK